MLLQHDHQPAVLLPEVLPAVTAPKPTSPTTRPGSKKFHPGVSDDESCQQIWDQKTWSYQLILGIMKEIVLPTQLCIFNKLMFY